MRDLTLAQGEQIIKSGEAWLQAPEETPGQFPATWPPEPRQGGRAFLTDSRLVFVPSDVRQPQREWAVGHLESVRWERAPTRILSAWAGLNLRPIGALARGWIITLPLIAAILVPAILQRVGLMFLLALQAAVWSLSRQPRAAIVVNESEAIFVRDASTWESAIVGAPSYGGSLCIELPDESLSPSEERHWREFLDTVESGGVYRIDDRHSISRADILGYPTTHLLGHVIYAPWGLGSEQLFLIVQDPSDPLQTLHAKDCGQIPSLFLAQRYIDLVASGNLSDRWPEVEREICGGKEVDCGAVRIIPQALLFRTAVAFLHDGSSREFPNQEWHLSTDRILGYGLKSGPPGEGRGQETRAWVTVNYLNDDDEIFSMWLGAGESEAIRNAGSLLAYLAAASERNVNLLVRRIADGAAIQLNWWTGFNQQGILWRRGRESFNTIPYGDIVAWRFTTRGLQLIQAVAGSRKRRDLSVFATEAIRHALRHFTSAKRKI